MWCSGVTTLHFLKTLFNFLLKELNSIKNQLMGPKLMGFKASDLWSCQIEISGISVTCAQKCKLQIQSTRLIIIGLIIKIRFLRKRFPQRNYFRKPSLTLWPKYTLINTMYQVNNRFIANMVYSDIFLVYDLYIPSINQIYKFTYVIYQE